MEGNFFADIRQELMRELDQEAEWRRADFGKDRRSGFTANQKEQFDGK